MNTTEHMMNDYYTPMANRIPICVCKGETSFHLLSLEGFSGARKKFSDLFSFRFGGIDCLAPFLRAAIEWLAMAGVVFFAALFTLLLGI